MAATIMVALDSTIVNVALHTISEDLDAGAGIEWVVTAYLLAVCVSQPAVGWLADRFGRKPVFVTSVAWFTIASALCGLAPNLGLLIAARVFQGLGGGALLPVGMTIAFDVFPPARRGRAMAVWGMSAMAAPALGPSLGGWLVNEVSWHWLFLINVPIGVMTCVAAVRLVPSHRASVRRPFDLTGLLLGSGGLALFILGVSQGNLWGWTSPATVACVFGGTGALFAFVVHSLHQSAPLIDLRMFSVKVFRTSTTAVMLLTLTQYARLVFMPLQLQELRDHSALDVGLLFVPASVATAMGMHLGGSLVDRVGPRWPVVFASLGVMTATLGFWQLTATTPIWVIALLMVLQGASWGVTTSPLTVAGMSEISARLLPQAAAIRSLAHQVAAALSVALLAAVIAVLMPAGANDSEAWNAYAAGYLVASVAAFGASLLALKLPGTAASHAVYADTRAHVVD